MHVRFSGPFDFTPQEDRRVTVAYPAGWEGPVRRDCGVAAIAAGRAEEIAAPPARPSPADDTKPHVKPDPLDHDRDGRKGGSVAGRRRRG